MAIYEMTSDAFRAIPQTTFVAAGLKERSNLQRLLREKIDVICEGTLILCEEFCDWEDSKRRIDLLGLDKDANLVVIELKRGDEVGHMELQALRYAAMVSAMTFEKAVDVYAAHLARRGKMDDARAGILEFLGWDEPDEDRFAQDIRIVLVASDFSKELTTTVMWLNERDFDITCVRLKPYQDGSRILIDVQQVIPLPEASDYIVRLREKETRERTSRKEQSALPELCRGFWTGLLQKARPRTELYANISPTDDTWLGKSAAPGLNFNFCFGRTVPRVELYIYGNARRSAKEIFDRLHADRVAIENRFGGPLGWERLDTKHSSRIRADLPGGSVRDQPNWDQLQDQMIDLMIRFERALRPAIETVEGSSN